MKLIGCVLLGLMMAASSNAALITSSAGGGTITTFTGTGCNCGVTGPIVIDGFSIDGIPNFSYGDVTYGLASNGTWSGLSWVATNSSASSVTIDLGGLYDWVGGFMNYAPGTGSPMIEAVAVDGTTVLESYILSTDAPISTPGGTNAGAFRGISRGSADIAFFRFSNAYLLMHNIELNGTSSAVPEPATMSLSALALVGLATLRRRVRRQA